MTGAHLKVSAKIPKKPLQNGVTKPPETTLTSQQCRVPVNFLGGTSSGNLAPTPPPAGMDLQNHVGDLRPPPCDKAFLEKVWPERSWFPLSTSYPEINQRGHIGEGSAGSPESKTVGVATVLQTTPQVLFPGLCLPHLLEPLLICVL